MVSLLALWLPILLSAVAVFLVSSVLHMVLRYHSTDFAKLPDEDAALASLGGLNIPPGDYYLPHCASMKDAASDAYIARCTAGPVALMTVLKPGPPKMAGSLVAWFVYSLVVGVFTAYIARMALPADADYLLVHRVTGAAAFMGYGLAHMQQSIWYKRGWSVTFKYLFDALVFGLCTGGVFGWLWPAA